MKNIIYYLKQFGKKSFKEFQFNEIDSLILCQIAYLSLDDLIPALYDGEPAIPLQGILTDENIGVLKANTLDEKRNGKMLEVLKDCPRYQGMKMNYFENRFYVDKVEQFCAVTFLFEDFNYVAYRGTDLTLLGWKEDFNMSLFDIIPSQKDATSYLNKIYELNSKPLYVGGHSKGGNLALFAALYCNPEITPHIKTIFNHDGPGFNHDIYETEEYERIKGKIIKMSCKQAMIGILMYHSEELYFVKSRSVGIFQHDPYNWKITKDGKFKLVKYPALTSKIFEKTVIDFLENTSIAEREIFIDLLFKIAMDSDETTIMDIKRHPISYFRRVRSRYKKLSSRQRQSLKRTIKKAKIIFRQNTKYFFSMKRRFGDKRMKENLNPSEE